MAAARTIFRCHAERLEIAGLGDAVGVAAHVRRQFGNGDLGKGRAHPVALVRVVVDEDEGVEAQAQPLGDPAQIGRLVVPVGHEGGDLAWPQHHLGMVFECLQGVGRIVLGDDRQHDARRDRSRA